jgi:hypothetical protein
MSDRRLLELAAKAAGMTIDTHYVDGGASVWEGERHHSDWIPDWNPLNDDGDALRLAVRLELWIFAPDIDDLKVHVRLRNEQVSVAEKVVDDSFAATRRAIVRAAAEIGRSMT